MTVTCDRCHNEIAGEHIDPAKGTAKCTNCNSVFDCSSQLETNVDYRRDTIELPRNIKLIKEKDRLTIQHSWLSSQLLYLAPFCLCWDLSLFIWYQIGFISMDSSAESLYVIFHIASAILLTYYCLAGFLNRTIITVGDGTLAVIDKPMPFFRDITVKLDTLDQLYSKEKRQRGKKLTWPYYEVHAILKPERDVRLVARLNTSEQALYIEQVVEDYLGIQDRPVEGEIAR